MTSFPERLSNIATSLKYSDLRDAQVQLAIAKAEVRMYTREPNAADVDTFNAALELASTGTRYWKTEETAASALLAFTELADVIVTAKLAAMQR